MNWNVAFASGMAALLAGYLTVALLKPEWFS